MFFIPLLLSLWKAHARFYIGRRQRPKADFERVRRNRKRGAQGSLSGFLCAQIATSMPTSSNVCATVIRQKYFKLNQNSFNIPCTISVRVERLLLKEFKNSENVFRSVWKTRGECVEELCSQVKLSFRKGLSLHCVLTKIRVPAAPRKIPQVCMWLNVRADVTEFAIPTDASISCGSLPDVHQLTPISLLRAGAPFSPGPGRGISRTQ